jgi:phosphoribosylamine-glycine ligase
MAAAGYPLTPRKGDAISGLPKEAGDAMVFHAGTVQKDGVILTSGGRSIRRLIEIASGFSRRTSIRNAITSWTIQASA